MMTIEISVSGREPNAEAERDLADRVLAALTEGDSAPAETMDKARQFVHVLVHRPRTWATGGPATDTTPRYLVRVTVPQSWGNEEFASNIIPMITDAIAGTEPDPGRLRREPHCVVQIVGLREHCIGVHGRSTTGTELTRLMTEDFRDSGRKIEAPDGFAVDPTCGMLVEWATARITLTHNGVDYAFCAPSCRKVFLEDHAGV
ncbi:YHS domain-containing protein [Nocardia paucivorans]|uniref:YHS domain-containing protein n=1 Tax=Nocardia paucivorans TaxID=114259 RepID=UPI0002DA4C0B|nr:YHS domain-containing protein [Nocardia paucivorans]